MTALAPGQMVNDHVRLLRPIGRWAMGDVWVARHENLNVDVAVKLIVEGLSRNDVVAERFQREARCAAQLRSRHVVRIYDQGRNQGGLAYMVMELLEGTTLGIRLAEGARMPLEEVTKLVNHVAAALGEAHGRGIVHRDVKPANIFLAKEGGETVVKLLDFGVAKQPQARGQKTLTEAGALIGSPHYMSPEQLLNSKGVDHSCDLWALAAVAYRALVGKPPFPGDNVGEIALAVIDAKFRRPTAVDASLPQALDDWFESALNREPGERFSTADQLARSFEAAATSPPRPVAAGKTLIVDEESIDDLSQTVQRYPDDASQSRDRPTPEPVSGEGAAQAPRRWHKTERIDGSTAHQLRASASGANRQHKLHEDPTARRPSHEFAGISSIPPARLVQHVNGPPGSLHGIPISHIRPRMQSPEEAQFVSGSYQRLAPTGIAPRPSPVLLAQPPQKRWWRVALWLVAAGTTVLGALFALAWWL